MTESDDLVGEAAHSALRVRSVTKGYGGEPTPVSWQRCEII